MLSLFKKGKKTIRNLEEAAKKIEELDSEIAKINKELKERKKESESHIQKFGLIRYNPFNELGGDQSFSLALLDKHNNGIVVTSIFNHEKSRVFGKMIINGESQYRLSKEEGEAIEQAKNK
jgi:hypothetical protein